jgi:hypothetical protein
MGYIRHDAIVATTEDFSVIGKGNATATVEQFLETIPAEYRKFLVGPVRGMNGTDFWCFLPDGSKEGWEYSDEAGEWRERFVALLAGTCAVEYVGVSFGGDLEGGPFVSISQGHA